MDLGIWEIIKSLLQLLVFPIVAGLAYFFRKYIHKVDKMEADIRDIEIRTAVVESKIDDIRDALREIKRGVEKLIDRKQ